MKSGDTVVARNDSPDIDADSTRHDFSGAVKLDKRLPGGRNINLDLMRLTGLLIIMVAHASPPGWLFQIRNFGTPLLVVASALTYAHIYNERLLEVSVFYRKRIGRLVISTWLFLTFFFVTFYFICFIFGLTYPFSSRAIAESYMLYEGIGFVWVIKIYVIMALITPFAIRMAQSNVSNERYFCFLLLAYFSYEIVVRFSHLYMGTEFRKFFDSVIFTTAPYIILYMYGMRLAKLNVWKIISFSVVSLAVFIAIALIKYLESGYFIPTQKFKYPPTLYYVSYAVFALNIVYISCMRIRSFPSKVNSAIAWLSENSLWIYLWHIFAFFLWKIFIHDEPVSLAGFLIKCMFMIAFGICMTRFQVESVARYMGMSNWLRRYMA